MEFYIKEWADKSASLITRDGYRLWTFINIDAALVACRDWYNVSEDRVIPDLSGNTHQTLSCSTGAM